MYDRHEGSVNEFQASLKHKPMVVKIDDMVDLVDLVVECASQQAVKGVAIPTLKNGKSIMIMSVGALIDEGLFDEIKRLSHENNSRVYLPSGAIAGLDALKSAYVGGLSSVTLITRKPPHSLEGCSCFEDEGLDISSIEEERLVFEGSADEAVKLFPANVNVAASLSIAGIGAEHTTVKVIADPKLSRNTHELHVVGEFGEFKTRVENLPSPSNPKTSYLAALSAIATLKKIVDPIQVGT